MTQKNTRPRITTLVLFRYQVEADKYQRVDRSVISKSLSDVLTGMRFEKIIMRFVPDGARETEWFNTYVKTKLTPGGHIEYDV